MCQAAVRLISNALKEVENAEILLKVKGVVALFIHTMDVCDSSIPRHTVAKCTLVLGLFSSCPG